MTSASPEQRIDDLFALAPEEFTKARDAAAKELKDAGDAEAAKRVRALRKPTLAAWALNQLGRRHPGQLKDLLEAGERLREAQSAAVGGGSGADLRRRAAERAGLVEQLVRRASAIIEESGASASIHLERIEQTLLASATDARTAELLSSGRLEKPVEAEANWGWTGGESPVEPEPTRRRPSDAKLKRARQRLEESEGELKEARAKAREADRAAAGAREALRKAERAAEAEAKRAEAADRAVEEARARLEDLRN